MSVNRVLFLITLKSVVTLLKIGICEFSTIFQDSILIEHLPATASRALLLLTAKTVYLELDIKLIFFFEAATSQGALEDC